MAPDTGHAAVPRPLPAVEFYYLRHGETDWNRAGRLQGNIDVALNATGRAQAAAAREALRGLKLSAIYCSALQRARETAEIVNEALGLPLVVWAGLEECRLGVLEGSVPPRSSPTWFERWRDGETMARAEPYAAFLDRAEAAVRGALEDSRRFAAPPLLVAHGGVYWSVQRALSLPQRFTLRNGEPQRHRPLGPGRGWEIVALTAAGGPLAEPTPAP